ncbi:hypothetical protein ACWWJF_14090 [Symbiopectobacterium sp. Eva_TO]
MNALIHGVLSILFKKWPKDVYNDMDLSKPTINQRSVLQKWG